jgi:putative tricarboxylic transport membrane protein
LKLTTNQKSKERSMIRKLLRPTVFAVALSMMSAGMASAEIRGLEILVPAAPGSGADQTARAMSEALQQDDLASRIQITNIPGAGGTIGLAQFVTSKKGKGNAVMVTFYVMIGAIAANKPPVTLDDVTPLARLSGEYEVIVVSANSPIRSMSDLVEKFKADPQSVSWGGGGVAGVDHILAGKIAKAVGVDPRKVNYIAHSGGGEALSSILGGHVTVGISGWQEFAGQVKAGQLRLIGISAPERVEGIDGPTLKEQGVDVVLPTWRGLVAPADIKGKDLEALSAAVDKMVKSDAWQKVLKERGWLDLYMPHAEFKPFLDDQRTEVSAILKDLGLAE